jgi:hypothetical protein
MKHSTAVTVVLLAATLLGVGCGDDADNGPAADGRPPSSNELTATLAEQRAKWEAAAIDSYEFTLSWLGFGNPDYGVDYRVTVVNGEPAGIGPIGGTELDPGWLTELPGSIDEVFDRLEREVGADRVDAHYDPDIGYPIAVHVDRMISRIDDELEIRIYDLTIETT